GSKDKSISELVKKLPARYTYSNRLQDISVKTSMSLINLGLTDREVLFEAMVTSGYFKNEETNGTNYRYDISAFRVYKMPLFA
ncbi:hypothetical protein MJN54_30590, partial [Salmonella enterica subsp. enterica serovar Kentucky]|nr:hypothetical protein [Salmonella enterica subsp. enterica serovar Kentucky]